MTPSEKFAALTLAIVGLKALEKSNKDNQVLASEAWHERMDLERQRAFLRVIPTDDTEITPARPTPSTSPDT
jgi:hypothetical protein